MNTAILFGVAVVPTIIGLVEVCKRAGLPSQFAPALAVLYGILAAVAEVLAGTYTWIPAVFLGISFGLSASGLYSGVKTALWAVTSNEPGAMSPEPASTAHGSQPTAQSSQLTNAAAAPVHIDPPAAPPA
jgi:hypothetical protein